MVAIGRRPSGQKKEYPHAASMRPKEPQCESV